MRLLDTDHLTVLVNRHHSAHARLIARMAIDVGPFAIPIISVEEQCRGWLAQIRRLRVAHDQVAAYENFARLLEFLRQWSIEVFDSRAADEYERLRRLRIRIGTHDLKIAAIALTRDASLLSANLRDFRQVPGLRVESWIE
jgi:tRNA(fMet)-specific endonuclease VapC